MKLRNEIAVRCDDREDHENSEQQNKNGFDHRIAAKDLLTLCTDGPDL